MSAASVRAAGARPLSAVLAALPAAVLGAARELWTRPSLLVALILVLVCIPIGSTPEDEGSAVSPADVAALALVGLVAVRGIAGRPAPLLRGGVIAASLAVGVAAGAATITATDAHLSLVGAVRFVEIFVAIPLAVALSLRSRADLAVVLGTIVAVGVAEGAVGVYQYVTGTGAAFGAADVRAVGTFGAYDIMTMALVVTVALLAALAVAFEARGPVRVVAGVCAVFLTVPLAMSLSRGSWLAAAVAVVVMLAASGARRLLLVGAVAALIAFVAVGFGQADLGVVGERFGSLAAAGDAPDRSVRDRYDLWTTAVEMWKDRPVTGVGPRNFSVWRDTYAPLSLSSTSDIEDPAGGFRQVELLSPHNLYLLVLSEQGLLGLLALGALLLALAAGAGRRLRSTREPGMERVIGLLAIAFLARFAVSGLWSDIGGPGTIVSATLLGVVLWFAAGGRTSPPTPVRGGAGG